MVLLGLPADLKTECCSSKCGEWTFRWKGDILLQGWKDGRVVCTISIVYGASIVEVPGRYRNSPLKKLLYTLKYKMFMKGVDRANQYLSYYYIIWKTVKWQKKVVFCLINCTLFNSFRVYQKLNPPVTWDMSSFSSNWKRFGMWQTGIRWSRRKWNCSRTPWTIKAISIFPKWCPS